MDIEQQVFLSGGIVRTRALARLGYSEHRIRMAVAAGRLWRPHRGWVANPRADPELVLAVRNRVAISCVSQAKRLGLWIGVPPDRLHASVRRSGAKVTDSGITAHWAPGPIPRDPDTLVDPVENALFHIAGCLPQEEAVTVWESALNKELVTLAGMGRLPLAPRARAVLDQCTPFADSGLESIVRYRLRWLPVRIRTQVWLLDRPVDLLIGERLVVQIDGAHHTGLQRDADNLHDAKLALQGYRVIRLSYRQVMHLWKQAKDLIVGAIARGEHLAR